MAIVKMDQVVIRSQLANNRRVSAKAEPLIFVSGARLRSVDTGSIKTFRIVDEEHGQSVGVVTVDRRYGSRGRLLHAE